MAKQGGGSRKRAKTTNLTQRISRLQRVVAALSPEVKDYYAGFNVTPTPAVAYISPLFLPVQGTSIGSRIGDTVRLKRILWRATLVSAPGATFPGITRWYIIKDADSNGATPTVAGGVTSFLQSIAPGTAMLNAPTMNRFKILKELEFTRAGMADGNGPYNFKGTLSLDETVHFLGNAGTIADCGKNTLYVVAITDDAAGTIQFRLQLHFQYTDV